MTTTVRRRSRPTGVAGKFEQFLVLDLDSKELASRANVLKTELRDFAAEHGEEDEGQHRTVTLPEPIEVHGKRFLGFTRQRRISQSFDEDAAETLCEEKGFAREDYISVQEYVDQDKIARLYAEDRLTDDEFKSLVRENETFAFVPVKAGR